MNTDSAAAAIGVTYRQLDNLARTVPSVAAALGGAAVPGSGNRRHWPLDLVVRLSIAARVAEAFPCDDYRSVSRFPLLAALTTDGPVPPPAGWCIATTRRVTYVPAAAAGDLPDVLAEEGAALVVRYHVDDALIDAAIAEAEPVSA